MVENKKEVNISFAEGFSTKDMHLFEVDEEFIAQIETGQNNKFAQIKTTISNLTKEVGNEVEVNKKAGMQLITDSRTFKLKIAESTNNSYVMDFQNGQIQMKTSNQIEVTLTNTKVLQLLDFLQQNASYSIESGDKKMGVTIEQILEGIQISEGELNSILKNPDMLARLQIMPVKETSTFVHIDSREYWAIIEKLLTLLGCHELEHAKAFEQGIDVNTVKQLNQGELNQNYADGDVIWIGLAALGSLDGDKFKFTAEKVRKSLAIALIVQKGDYILEEFTQVYMNAIEMALLPSVLQEVSTNNEQTPLFEGYGTDFSFLRGQAVIRPSVHNSGGEQAGKTVIIWLDPYFTPVFYHDQSTKQLSTTFEQQIGKLFSVKGKWCLSELEVYLKDYIEPEGKLTQLLTRWTRTIKEQNPFNNKIVSTFYVPKF